MCVRRQATVTAIPIGSIVPGQPICTAVKELQDDFSKRSYLSTGKSPNGVALEYFGVSPTPVGAVVNQADNEVQFFDPTTLQPLSGGLGTISQRFTVGESPLDVAFSGYDGFNNWLFAFIVNQGGVENPQGSVSLWWNANTVIPLFRSNSGSITGSLADGVNVPGRPSSDPLGFYAWIANTAGTDVIKAQIVANGSGLGTNINLKTSIHREVGPNPTRMTWTGDPNNLMIAFASLAGLMS